LLTVERSDRVRRTLTSDGDEGTSTAAEGADLPALLEHCLSELDPDAPVSIDMTTRRSRRPALRLAGAASRVGLLSDLVSERAVRHVFLKQFRDAEDGELACIQQVVEARSTVAPGSLRWRRLRGTYDLSVSPLATHPLEDELGLELNQTIRLAFAAEFGFRMESGELCWP
jgi:hypothetical protein